MERYASMRPTWEHISLFKVISNNEVAQDTDRQAITERAIRYVESLDNYKDILKSAARQRIEKVEVAEIPVSLKVRVDSQMFNEVVNKFRETFEIERVKTPFLMRVTLMAYLQYINSGDRSIQEKMERKESIQSNVIDIDDRLMLMRKIAGLLVCTSEDAKQKIIEIKRIVEG